MYRSIAALAMVAAFSAQAEDVKQFQDDRYKAWQECVFLVNAGAIMERLGQSVEQYRERAQKIEACVAQAVEVSKAPFKVAAAATGAPAAESLKAYYASWRAAMAGLSGLHGTPESTRRSALVESERQMQQAWARFEIDAGL